MPETPILAYRFEPPVVQPWDERTWTVARRVRELVAAARPGLEIEHVGSSSVRDLPGRGVVDLVVAVEPSTIPGLTRDLLALGFQPQPGPAPWPPTRPMLVGAMEEGGDIFRIHLHVVPVGRGELAELLAFRDALRADEALRSAYVRAKHEVVDAGVPRELYAVRKGDFVEAAYYRLGIRRPPADRPLPLAPGATIGVLGGGQLGRMLGMAARSLGYRITALDPDPACPTAAVADGIVVGGYGDTEAALRLAEDAAVVTFELEHVSERAVAAVAARVPVRPGLRTLRVTQDRLAERRFLRDHGDLTAPWREVRGLAEATAAADALGYPLRLKAPIGGYDGRSQRRIAGPAELAAAVEALGGGADRPLLLERELEFLAELSAVCARDRDGRTLAFPVSQNVHDDGILVESIAPAPVPPAVAAGAQGIAASIARALDVVGILTVELFQLEGGLLAVNELAPRVHNSGHWTIEGASTSQFEQHVRAIAGLPMGAVTPHGAAAMVNVLGTGPDRPARLAGLDRALADPGVHVHVYGKRRVFERRKMGHVTVVAEDHDEAIRRARAARSALSWEN